MVWIPRLLHFTQGLNDHGQLVDHNGVASPKCLILREQQYFVWDTASQSTKWLDMLKIWGDMAPWLRLWYIILQYYFFDQLRLKTEIEFVLYAVLLVCVEVLSLADTSKAWLTWKCWCNVLELGRAFPPSNVPVSTQHSRCGVFYNPRPLANGNQTKRLVLFDWISCSGAVVKRDENELVEKVSAISAVFWKKW